MSEKLKANNLRYVVVADGHYNPLGLVRSLGREGIHADVVVVGGKDAMIARSKYVNSLAFVDSPHAAIDYVMDKFANSSQKSFLMTGADVIVSEIDLRYDELKPFFITYNCGESGALNALLFKRKQNDIAKRLGLNVPDYEEVEVGELPMNVQYPIITKAVSSLEPNWKSLVHICRNQNELMEVYKSLPSKRILLQHYIAKKNETGFNGISINSGQDVYLPLQLTYFSTELDTFGNAIYLFQPVDMDLCEKVKKLMGEMRYEGAFSVDFVIGEDGKVYFLEVNLRNSAWSFPYTCAGCNLPVIWAKSMLSGALETENVKIRKLPFSSIVDLWEVSAQMKKGVRNGLKALCQAFKSDSHILWDWRDWKPFAYLVKCWIKNHILHK